MNRRNLLKSALGLFCFGLSDVDCNSEGLPTTKWVTVLSAENGIDIQRFNIARSGPVDLVSFARSQSTRWGSLNCWREYMGFRELSNGVILVRVGMRLDELRYG